MRRADKRWKAQVARQDLVRNPGNGTELWHTSMQPKYVVLRWLVRKEERRMTRMEEQRKKEEMRAHDFSVRERRQAEAAAAAEEPQPPARPPRPPSWTVTSPPKVFSEREISLVESAERDGLEAGKTKPHVDAARPTKVKIAGGPSLWRPYSLEILPTFPSSRAIIATSDASNERPTAPELVVESTTEKAATPTVILSDTSDAAATHQSPVADASHLSIAADGLDTSPRTALPASTSDAALILNALPRTWGKRIRLMTLAFPEIEGEEPIQLRVSTTYDYKSEYMRHWRTNELEADLFPLNDQSNVDLATTRLPFRSVASEGDLAHKARRDMPVLRKVRSAPEIPSGQMTDVVADWTLPTKKRSGERYSRQSVNLPPRSAGYPVKATGSSTKRSILSLGKPTVVIHQPKAQSPATQKSILKKIPNEPDNKPGPTPLSRPLAAMTALVPGCQDGVRFAGDVKVRQFRTSNYERLHVAKQGPIIVKFAKQLAASDLSVDQISAQIDQLFEEIEELSPLDQHIHCSCESDHVDDPEHRCYQRWLADYPGGAAQAWQEMEELDYDLPPTWLDYASTPASHWDPTLASVEHEMSEMDKCNSFCKNVLLPPIPEAEAEANCVCSEDKPKTLSSDSICAQHGKSAEGSNSMPALCTGSSSESSPLSTPDSLLEEAAPPSVPKMADWLTLESARLIALMEMEEDEKENRLRPQESGVDTTSSESSWDLRCR